MATRAVVVCNNFQEGFGHHTGQNSHLQDESKWESFRRLDSDGLDIGGLKAKNIIVPGQNIAFS